MEILLFIIIILIASILQTSTGFGFSILATPFLLILFEPKEAIQINLILSLIISIFLISKIKKDVDFRIVKRLIIGSVFGIGLGMTIFLFLEVTTLKLMVSIILLVLTILLIFNFRIKQTERRDCIAGILSGGLTTSIGMPGIPLLLYFSGTNTTKSVLRGTTLAFYLFIYFFSLITQLLIASTNMKVWMASGAALPLVIIGLVTGQWLFHIMNQHIFKIFTYGLLLFTGIYLLLNR